jgi:hypothetical protein
MTRLTGAVVARVDVDGAAIGLDRGLRVLELDELVAHEGPCREEAAVELEGSLEVDHRSLGVGRAIGVSCGK